MDQFVVYTLGTPVKMEYVTKENEPKEVFAKILCSNQLDQNFYSCITPHGTIIKTHFSKLNILIDDIEKYQLEELENNSLRSNNVVYNNLFYSCSNSGSN